MAKTSPRELSDDPDLIPTIQPGETGPGAFGRRVRAKRRVVGNLVTSDVGALSPRTRDVLGSFLGPRIGPSLARAAAAQAGRPGASIEGILANLSTTGGAEVARELAGLQSEIERVKRGIPEAPSTGESVLGGAVEGGAAAGLIGAGFGAVGGFLKGSSEREAEERAKGEAEGAALEATPEAFGQELEAQEPEARLEALTSGAGANRQQLIEGLVAATGLRDTGLGTLASIAAGVQVPLAEVQQTFQSAMQQTTRDVEERVGAVRQTQVEPDRIAQALEALSTAFLMRGGRGTTGGTAEGEELNPLSGLGNLFPTKEDPDSPIDTSVF